MAVKLYFQVEMDAVATWQLTQNTVQKQKLERILMPTHRLNRSPRYALIRGELPRGNSWVRGEATAAEIKGGMGR
jgi:hypothetical protein